MVSPAQLLVVSPDGTLLSVVERCVQSLGHEPVTARTAAQARRSLTRLRIDVLGLDSVLADEDARSVYEAFIATKPGDGRVVLFGPPSAKVVSAHVPEFLRKKLEGFVAKPIDAASLARELAHVLSGSAQARDSDLLRAGELSLDRATYRLSFARGPALALTPMEYKLIRHLMERPGEYVSTQDLLSDVWGYPADSAPELVRAHVSNVRKKLRKLGQNDVLRTRPYHGYAFVV
jgi:DNA-binding response OmpR family regulator